MTLYDAGKVAELVANVRATAKRGTNTTKGNSMADLVAYMFGEIPGLELRHREFLTPDGTSEIDLTFRNRAHISRLFTGVTLHFECKNERKRISTAQVRVFASKLRDLNQPIGIMISRTGLAGRKGVKENAHAMVAAEMQSGRTIVVLSLDDLEELRDSGELVELCLERQFELETYGVYSSI